MVEVPKAVYTQQTPYNNPIILWFHRKVFAPLRKNASDYIHMCIHTYIHTCNAMAISSPKAIYLSIQSSHLRYLFFFLSPTFVLHTYMRSFSLSSSPVFISTRKDLRFAISERMPEYAEVLCKMMMLFVVTLYLLCR